MGPGPGWRKPGSGGVACFCAFGPVSCVCVGWPCWGGLELYCNSKTVPGYAPGDLKNRNPVTVSFVAARTLSFLFAVTADSVHNMFPIKKRATALVTSRSATV